MPKTTQPRKTWQYTKDFKIKAVKLTLLYDYKVKDVASSLGIHRCMLSRWRKEFREGTLHGDDKLRLDTKYSIVEYSHKANLIKVLDSSKGIAFGIFYRFSDILKGSTNNSYLWV